MKEKSSTLALNMLLLPPSVQDGLRWRARWCGDLRDDRQRGILKPKTTVIRWMSPCREFCLKAAIA